MIINGYKGTFNIKTDKESEYEKGFYDYDLATDLCRLLLLKKSNERVLITWCKTIMNNDNYDDGQMGYSPETLKKEIIKQINNY